MTGKGWGGIKGGGRKGRDGWNGRMEGRGNGRRAVWQRHDAERGEQRGSGGGERTVSERKCKHGKKKYMSERE